MSPFERRIYLGVVAVIFSFVPLILGTFYALDKIVKEQRRLIMVNATQVFEAERLRYIDSTQGAIMPIYILSGEPRLMENFEIRHREFGEMLASMEASEDDPESHALIMKIKTLSQELHRLASPGIEMRRQGAPIAAVNEYFARNTAERMDELNVLLNALVARQGRELEDARGQLDRTVNLVLGSLVFLLGLATALIVYFSRRMVKTIRQKRMQDDTQDTLYRHERRISRARKEVIEVVAHDLKNPLGTIKMSLQMMLDKDLQGAGIPPKEGLEIALRSAETMERLIHDLLDHAKIEAGHLVLDQHECDVAQMARDQLRQLEPLAKQKNILLTHDIPEGVLMSVCDRGRLEQVLSNLLGNALKFTEPGGRIGLRLRLRGSNLIIEVSDTGAGIAKEQLPHIFDRFWQVHETARHGSGLGLAIAKAVIDAHHGRIWVESEPRRGSRFSVSLPREPDLCPA